MALPCRPVVRLRRRASRAAFVQPTTRSVTTILRTAPDHRLERITCVNSAASFERTVQTVRTTGHVLADHFGACIVLAVLYAACVEAAGLFPVIFMCRNRANSTWRRQGPGGEAPDRGRCRRRSREVP